MPDRRCILTTAPRRFVGDSHYCQKTHGEILLIGSLYVHGTCSSPRLQHMKFPAISLLRLV